MVRYLIFSKLDISGVICLLEYPIFVVKASDIAIVPATRFSDADSQKKIVIMAKKMRLFSDFGVRKYCSHITIAGYLYNSFFKKVEGDKGYYKTKNGFYDMLLISDEINYALREGFNIFDELISEESELHRKCSEILSRGSKVAKPCIYEGFVTKMKQLLKYYRDGIDDKINEILKDDQGILNYYGFVYGSNHIYNCYPYLDFQPSLKKLTERYKQSIDSYISCNVLYNIKELFKIFDTNNKNYNYILLLNRWCGNRVKTLKTDLFTSICNSFQNFQKITKDFGFGNANYDMIFPFFNYLMHNLNKTILDNFTSKSCVFYYADLKRQLIEHPLVRGKFSEIYKCFSKELKLKYFSAEKYNDENEVLKEYFFNTGNLLGKSSQTLYNEPEFLVQILLNMDYNWLTNLVLNNIEFCSRKCSILQQSTKFLVKYDKEEDGLLQVLKFQKRHYFVCDFVDGNNFKKVKTVGLKSSNHYSLIQKIIKLFKNSDDNSVSDNLKDRYDIESRQVVIFYDSFYIYVMQHNKIRLKIYYKTVFPNVDVTVLILISKIFNLCSLQVMKL